MCEVKTGTGQGWPYGGLLVSHVYIYFVGLKEHAAVFVLCGDGTEIVCWHRRKSKTVRLEVHFV